MVTLWSLEKVCRANDKNDLSVKGLEEVKTVYSKLNASGDLAKTFAIQNHILEGGAAGKALDHQTSRVELIFSDLGFENKPY